METEATTLINILNFFQERLNGGLDVVKCTFEVYKVLLSLSGTSFVFYRHNIPPVGKPCSKDYFTARGRLPLQGFPSDLLNKHWLIMYDDVMSLFCNDNTFEVLSFGDGPTFLQIGWVFPHQEISSMGKPCAGSQF